MSPLLFALAAASETNMNGLSAIVQLVKALAWPLTVLFLVYNFRGDLRDLILSISTIKYGELELIVKRDLKQARLSLETGTVRAILPPTDKELSDLMSLAESAPRAAVIEAWTRLEAAGAAFIAKRPPSDFQPQRRPSGLGRI